MNKVTSYLKNIGKSTVYATADVSLKLIPDVKEFVDTNEELFKSIYATVSHSKKSINYGKKLARDSQLYKDIDKGIKNALEDIKSGNFYNKGRSDAAIDAAGSAMAFGGDDFGFDDDFDFDDNFDDGSLDDFEDKPQKASVDKGDLIIADSVTKSTNLSAQLISKTLANTSKAIMNTNVATTNMVMAQNVELMAGLRTSIMGMHQSINKALEFAVDVIKPQFDIQSQYFTKTESLMTENNAILKEMLEMQRNMYKKQEISKPNDQFSNVFSGGTIDLKEYFKAIGKNIKGLDKTGTFDMMTGSMGDQSMLSQMLSNPLGFVMTGLVSSFMPSSLAKSIMSFNKTLSGIFPAMIAKLNRWKNREDGSIFNWIGEIFGLSYDTKKSIDTGKYNKGAVPFDGITRKAIVDIIPEHLSRIESLLSGQSQRVYDFESGKWTNSSLLKKKFEDQYESDIKGAFSEITDDFKNFITTLEKQKALSYEQRQTTEKDMFKIMKKVYEEDNHFSPENIKKNLWQYGVDNPEIIEAFLSSIYDSKNRGRTSKFSSVDRNIYETKRRRGDRLRNVESEGYALERKLFDNSNQDEHLVIDEKYNLSKGINLDTVIGLLRGAVNGEKIDTNNLPKEIKKAIDKESNIASAYNKNSHDPNVKLEDALQVASFVVRQNFTDLDPDEVKKYGKFIDREKKFNKTASGIEGDTFMQKFSNAKSMRAKYAVIMSSLDSIAKKPVDMINGLIYKADKSIYNLLFGEEYDPDFDDEKKSKDLKGLMGDIHNQMTHYMTLFTESLDEKIITPLVRKYGLDEKWNKLKEKIGNTNIAQRIKQAGLNVKNALGKNVSSIKDYTVNSLDDVFSPILYDRGLSTIRIKSLSKAYSKGRSKREEELANLMEGRSTQERLKIKQQLTPEELEILRNLGFAEGGKGKVEKTGMIPVSKGETITVEPNSKSDKESDKDEEFDSLINSLKNLAKGQIDSKGKFIAKVKKINAKTNKADSTILSDITRDTAEYAKELYGQALGLVGKNTEEQKKSLEKEKTKLKDTIGSIIGEMKGEGADTVAKSIIGGGIGLFSGIVGGPLIGAAVGAGYSLFKNSQTVQDFLFGDVEKDENGFIVEQKGGKINKNIYNTFKKYLPDMGKYGVAGAVSSLLLPFGPFAGAAIGAGIGLAKNSTTMSEMLFGDEEGLFNKKRKEKIKKLAPKAAAGAIAGMFLGPFGLFGNAILGSGIGLLTGTEEFKNLILGNPDQNGTRFGGIKGALEEHFINPLKDFGSDFKQLFFNTIKEGMIDPLNRAITPIAEEIAYQTKRVVFGIPKMFTKLGKDYIAVPLMRQLEDKFIEPLGNLTKKFFGGTFNKIRGIVTAPFRMIGSLGDMVRKKQIREGRDVSGNAKNRLQFAKEKKMGNYQYRKFDESLAENSENQDYLEELTARTGMLAHGAEYFEKQVKDTGKILSKVLSDYKSFHWFDNDIKTYKKIKKYIEINDVESAIEELNNIKNTRTNGGRLSDDKSAEAIERFTEANKRYQATKKARESFAHLNEEENETWMNSKFGDEWKKWDKEKLFKYASSELGDLTGKNINKQSLWNNPTELVTKGDDLINSTLERIEKLLINAKERKFGSLDEEKEYDEAAKRGKTSVEKTRATQKLNIRSRLNSKNFDFKDKTDNVIDLLYSNEKIYSLVLYVAEKGITYDAETIIKLCEMKLDDNDIINIKNHPYIAGMQKNDLKKYLSYHRNNHPQMTRNKALRNSNLDILNDAISKGIEVNDTETADMLTYGGKKSKKQHMVRNDYFKKLKDLDLIGKSVNINGKETILDTKMIIDINKGLSYDQLDSIIKDAGGAADVFKEKTSINSAMHNFSDKHLGGVRKVGKYGAAGLGIAGLGLLASPVLLPLSLAGLGLAGFKGGSILGTKIKSIKDLGLGGFFKDKKLKKDINSDFNTTFENPDPEKYKDAENVKWQFTEYGPIKNIKDDRGDWTPDLSDSDTKKTLDKMKESGEEKKEFKNIFSSMKDGILGLFNRQKVKDEEEEKEPFLKRLFNFDLGSIGGKMKFGAIALAGLTGIGALKNLWDNREPGGILDTIGSKVGEYVKPIGDKVVGWFSGSGEYENGGLPKFLEDYVYPNLFSGFNVVFQKVLPALLKSFIISLPTLIKAGIDGVVNLVTGLLGWGDSNSNDKDNEISTNNIKIGNKSINGVSVSNNWLDKISADSNIVADDLIGTAEAAINGKNYTSTNTIENNYKSNVDYKTGYYEYNTDSNNQTSTTTTSNNQTSTTTTSNNKASNIINNAINKYKSNTTNNDQEMLSQPMTFGQGNQMYKKDSNGNLIPMTGEDYYNSGGQISEFYTEAGVRYIYDSNSGTYISELGDTYTDIDDGLFNRLGSVYTRSLLTGKNMGIMRLGSNLSNKFGGSLLGKTVKGGAKGVDWVLKKTPFLGKVYDKGKSAIKSFGNFTKNVSNLGVTGHSYASYAIDAFKEGYKPNEIIKDITKDTKLGKMASTVKNSKPITTISNIASSAKNKALNSSTGKKLAELGTKSSDLASKVISWVKNCFDTLFNNNVVIGKIKEGLSKAGKDFSDSAVKKVINEMIEKLMTKFSSSVIGKMTAKVLSKLSALIGSAGLITAAFSIVDFTVGFDQAESILGIEEVSFVQRILAAIINWVTNECFFGLVDADVVVDWCIDIIFPIFNINLDDFKKKREEAEANTKRINEIEGTDISTEERLKQGKLTWEATKLWNNGTNWVAENLDPFGWFDSDKERKQKETAANTATSITNIGKNLKDSITNSIDIDQLQNNEENYTQENVADTGNAIAIKEQGDQFGLLTSNIKSAFEIMDAKLGKIYGFTNSSGNKYISLSEGISNFNLNQLNRNNKGEYTFLDLINQANNSMMQMTNGISSITGSNKSVVSTTASSGILTLGSAIGSLFSGTGTNNEGFISQLDPKYKNKKLGKENIATAGCAPATAANVLNYYSGRGTVMDNATKAASMYQSSDGGVTPDYFENYLGKQGIGTYSTMNKNEMLSGIASGRPTILLGTDPTNRANTPYGASSSHYVLATGLDGRGNVIIQDPESKKPNALYPIKDIMKQSHLGMITGRGTGSIRQFRSKLKSSLKGLGFGRGSNTIHQDLATFSEITASELNSFIKRYAGSNRGFTGKGQLFIDASKASGLDPRYILAHAAEESSWGDSSLAKAGNFFGIRAYNSNPSYGYTFSHDSMAAGLIEGAKWIRKNYYDNNQKTLYEMIHSSNGHNYAVNNDGSPNEAWMNNIAQIMDDIGGNTNASYHEADSSITSSSSDSTASGLFSKLSEAVTSYYDPKLIELLFGSSSDSSSATSSAGSQSAQDFYNTYNGQKVDVDGFPAEQPYQCVDLFKQYLTDVVGYEGNYTIGGNGGAFNIANDSRLDKYFSKVDLNNAQYGDWVIWGPTSDNPYGHVAMYTGTEGNYIKAFGQNQNGSPNAKIDNIPSSGVTAVMRYSGGKGSSRKVKTNNFLSNSKVRSVSLPQLKSYSGKGISLPSLNTSSTNLSQYTTSQYIPTSELNGNSKVERLVTVVIEVLQIIADNTSKLSDVVSLLSKALDLNLTDNDISSLSSNNAQIKNKIANALKSQGSANGMGSSIMNSSTESLANALYSIARA